MKLIILILFIVLLIPTSSAWLPGYDYRVEIQINNTGNELEYYQYNFSTNTSALVATGKMNANGSDCRITNTTDFLQEFWNETPFNDSSTQIWVNATSLGNITNTTHYMYYSNSGASSVIDGDTTFNLFDDFTGVDGLELGYVTNLSKVGSLGSHDLARKGDYIYAAGYRNDSLYVVNVSDPVNPVLTATLTDVSSRLDGIHDIVVDGNYVYVTNINRDSIVAIDISIPSSPYIVGEVIDATKLDYVHALNKTGDYIYAGHYVDGTSNYFNIINATDPTNLSIVGYIQDDKLNGSRGVQVIGSYAYTVCRNSGRLVILDISNKTAPSITGDVQLTTTAGAKLINIRIKDNYAYVTNYIDNRLEIVDVSNASAPSAITTIAVTAANYIEIYDNYAYVGSSTADTLYIIDISDPTSPIHVDSFQHADLDMTCQVIKDNDNIFVSTRDEDNSILTVLNTTTISNTVDLQKWNKSGSPTISNGILTINTDNEYIESKDTTYLYKSLRFNANFEELYTRCQVGFKNDYTDTAPFEMFWKGVASNGIRAYSGFGAADIELTEVTGFGDSYHNFDIKWKSGEAKFYIDENLQATHTSKVMTTSEPVIISKRSGGVAGQIDVDWLFVHEYVVTDPIVSLGAEQSEAVDVLNITLVSFTPTPLNTNYTGETIISYMVESTNPLNLSSLAFLYGLNYTTTDDMHNYIATPPIDIASEGIYLAPNRNITPYLSWEFNDTITEGNVWQWGGGDNNSWWISKTPINATHTYINASGVTQHVLPSSFYIQKLAMYNAPKTGFEINRQQGIIFKMWNIEEIRNRGHNYFANLYFDTSWETTLPNYPVEIGYCNFSYDPTVDDIDTCQDCIKFGEWDGNRWVNHSWVPGANASYAYPLVINGSQYTEPTPTDINYIWLRSNTISSKSYILNATDYDPGITNITFAETNTMWTYNELNGVTSPVAYTPSFFTTFVRNDEELLHHLYIADDTGAWSHSDIFSESIGISSIPVSPVSFDFFNITCEESYHDYEMDATYDLGTVGVGMHCPADPDGTTVYHNLTLHYYPNMTLVAVINNTFTTDGVEDVEIEFTTTPYYSSNTLYTLRCVSKDGDDNVATKWLISYFALDADGNQGWVKDDKLLFWGMNDIPTLYMEVNNSSMISYDGGSDIYTMHVPFFKSKGNDTFNFNETVHLESLNNEDVAYFRFTGRTNFDNAIIHAWNTTTDTAAPITDEYRGYVYSLTMTCGNITNSNFSYLGGDFYRQEGLNFVGNSHEYLIHNSTFSHNGEGPIFEECSNFTILNCTISDNVNVGIGVYFSDNFIIENNTISSNGGRGVAMYEANNNIISYNDITNSGIHGVHYWSNSINNTCTGNDISRSALYDYYLSSSSTGNFIINPASTTDRIRVTSTSSVNIENTDNAVFSEDSLNTSYAYLTNFSMYVSGASQTFDITQRDMTITPSNDNLSIQNFDWGNTIQFNTESSIGVNQTWFNITNTRWKSEQISIFIDGLPHNISHADDNGTLDYNYSVSIGDNFFEFILTIPPSPVPVSLFMFMGVLLFVFCGASFILTGIPSIFTSILSIMFSFIMSKIAVNGSLVQNIGGISSTGTVVQGVTRIEIPALSYILIFVGIFMTVILAVQVLREIKFRKYKDIIELNL